MMMSNEQYIDLITGHLQGTLSAEEKDKFQRLIDEGEIDSGQFQEMEALFQASGKLPGPEPSDALRSNFYQMLEEEKRQQESSSVFAGLKRLIESFRTKVRWQVAAGALGTFVIGFLIGIIVMPFSHQQRQINQMSRQLTQMKQLASLTLLDNSSPIDRLKAVNISMTIPSSDNRVIEALLKTLNNDPNINVRLAAVQSLVKHGKNPAARKGLVLSIDKQKSPLVRVALADAMQALQEKKSVRYFKQLLSKDNLQPSVRQKLQQTVKTLNKKV